DETQITSDFSDVKNRPKKLQKTHQSEQVSETESEEGPSSISSYDSISMPSLAHCSSEEQIVTANKLHQNKDYKQTTLDKSLEVQNIKILVNNNDISDSAKSNASWVWKHMTKNKLKQEVACDVVTINLDGIEKKFESDKSTPTILSMLSKIDNHRPAKQQKLSSRLISWIVEDCQPLSVVEEKTFQLFCQEMDPRFKVPGSAHIKTKIRESVLFAEEQLRSLLSETMETFCFTTDMWTSMHTPYIGVTIHWLLKNFDLYQAVLTIEEFPYPHTGERQEQFLSKIFEYWSIHNKLIGGTTDNDKATVKEDSEWPLLGDEDSELESDDDSSELILPAQSTSSYPTLGMMLPTILLLLSHLHQMNESINSSILSVCEKIEDSISKRWETPLIEAYIASYLDPRFKNMSFTNNEKKRCVKNAISEMIEVIANTIDAPMQTEMDRFFDGNIQTDYLVYNELERYDK
ncbi:11012_t:CDS:2, partial [Gigaspora rosea]